MMTLGDIAGTQFHTSNIHNIVKYYCIFLCYIIFKKLKHAFQFSTVITLQEIMRVLVYFIYDLMC